MDPILQSKQPVDDPRSFLENPAVLAFLQKLSRRKANPDDFFQELFTKLMENNFQALRSFTGNSKRSTYLITLANNLDIDLNRKEKGRNYGRKNSGVKTPEPVKQMGPHHERAYELLHGEKRGEKVSYELMKAQLPGFNLSFNQFQAMAQQLVVHASKSSGLRNYATLEDPSVLQEVEGKCNDDIHGDLEKKMESEALKHCLTELSPDEQTLVRMRFQQDAKLKDLALFFKVSMPTVRARLATALGKLKTRLEHLKINT